MTWLRVASISCASALVLSVAMARVHPFGDAGLYAGERTAKPIMENATIPPEVRALLSSKCADCHALTTKPRFYGRFAPVSWLMERDINHGRQAMNLSTWDKYSADQQQTLAGKIVQQIREQKMPLPQYRMIHWKNRITDSDVRLLASWAHISSDPAPLRPNGVVGGGDATRGQALFERRCAGCHSLNQNHEGPRLQGVYGRTSGSVADFSYSAALKKGHITWDDTTLDKWLADPDALVPGNEMDFLISRPQERRDLIAFLRQNSRE